jgi:hypothetical protein
MRTETRIDNENSSTLIESETKRSSLKGRKRSLTEGKEDRILERVVAFRSGFVFSLRDTPTPTEQWKEIRARLSPKAWALYLALLDKAMYEESAIVTLSVKDANSLMTNETLKRVRGELSGHHFIELSRDNDYSPYRYEILSPINGKSLPHVGQRKVITKALEQCYPVREYTAEEFVRVLDRFLQRIEMPREHEPPNDNDFIKYICPFHELYLERYQKARIVAYPQSQRWHCTYSGCIQHNKKGGKRRGGDGGVVHFVTSYVWNVRRQAFKGTQQRPLPGQARELIEQILSGASLGNLCYTIQNVETRELITTTLEEWIDPKTYESPFRPPSIDDIEP